MSRSCHPLSAVVLVAFSLAGRLPLSAQICDRSGCGRVDCGTPARPVLANIWNVLGGGLQPVDANPMSDRDSTAFDEFLEQYSSYNWYEAIDIENGYLITALGYGLQVWDARTTPTSPVLMGHLMASSSTFPVWIVAPAEVWPLEDIAAPAGVDTIAAIVGRGGTGTAIVDLTDKTRPRVLYQNYDKEGKEVYATTIGGARYAFTASNGGNPGGGVYIYNMSQASQLATPCAETAPTDPASCPGVYVGTLGTRTSASYVHGVDNFVVLSSGTGNGFEIWNVANPQSPQRVLTGLDDPPTCGFDKASVFGVAMWKDADNRYYLGLRTQKYSCTQGRSINEARIYDVSCITGTCTSLSAPLFAQELAIDATYYFVTFSKSGDIPFLYFGSDDRCAGGSQREWLFDVSNPASPREITAPGYWTWYYRGSPTGFNYVMPRRGKFNGNYFYRAGLSILDIHQLTAPLASFGWTSAPIYSGAANPLTFFDRSSGSPTSWTWTITDVATSSAPPPQP